MAFSRDEESDPHRDRFVVLIVHVVLMYLLEHYRPSESISILSFVLSCVCVSDQFCFYRRWGLMQSWPFLVTKDSTRLRDLSVCSHPPSSSLQVLKEDDDKFTPTKHLTPPHHHHTHPPAHTQSHTNAHSHTHTHTHTLTHTHSHTHSFLIFHSIWK